MKSPWLSLVCQEKYHTGRTDSQVEQKMGKLIEDPIFSSNFIGILFGPTDFEGFRISVMSLTSINVTGILMFYLIRSEEGI